MFAAKSLQNEFNNSISLEHSVADESIIHKEEIVDFLASYVRDEISIYYGLVEFEYEWSNYFNEINYASPYYKYIYSIGREFDYLLKLGSEIGHPPRVNNHTVKKQLDLQKRWRRPKMRFKRTNSRSSYRA